MFPLSARRSILREELRGKVRRSERVKNNKNDILSDSEMTSGKTRQSESIPQILANDHVRSMIDDLLHRTQVGVLQVLIILRSSSAAQRSTADPRQSELGLPHRFRIEVPVITTSSGRTNNHAEFVECFMKSLIVFTRCYVY